MKVKASQKRKGFLCLALMAMGMTVANVQSATYPDMPYTGPTPIPAFPAAFEVFDPPINSDPVDAGAPAIAEWTRSNQPGDTMALSGSGMPSDYAIYAPAYLDTFSTTNWFGEHGALTLPYDLPANTMYLLWPIANDVAGAPVAINQTESWWLTETASAGGNFSIFGRNLGADCKVWVEEKNQWLNSLTCNPYKADFLVPQDYANGTYTLWAHNGKGREYGFARPLTLTVRSKIQWDENTDNWFDVTDYGAKGDGVTEDWFGAIEDALEAADAVEWSTVYFPAGNYRIGSKLRLTGMDKLRIVGEGMDSVTIRPHSSYTSSSWPKYIIQQNTLTDVQFKNITLEANSYGGQQMVRLETGVKNILFDSVRLNHTNAVLNYPNRPGMPEDTLTSDKLLACYGSENIRLENCEFIQKSNLLFSDDSSQIFVSNCTFIGTWDANTLMAASDGAQEISLIDSVARNYDDTQSENDADTYAWCVGRWMHGNDGFMNFYFGGNSTINLGPRTGFPDSNVGEQVMFEFAHTIFRGSPTSVISNTLSFDTTPDSAIVGKVAVIQDGIGQGQSRVVTALNGNTVTLDSDWLVRPTTSDHILIGEYTKNVAVYDNSFDGRPRATDTSYVAVIGVMPYGGCVDLVVDNNTFHELRYAYRVESKHSPYNGARHYQPNFFNLFMNGTITNCYHAFAMMVEREPDAIWSAPQMLANVYRNHDADTLSGAPMYYHGDYSSGSADQQMDMQIYDKNTYTNYTGAMEEYVRITEPEVINQVVIEPSALPPPPDPPPTPTLTGIAISGSTSVDEGTTAQYVCTASYSDGSTAQVAPNWSEDSNNADINSAGVLSAGDVATDESITVTASYGGFTDTHDVTINYVPVVLTGIVVSGPSSVDEETTVQYACTANYSDGSNAAVTPVWSENSSYATINGSGVLTAGNVASDQSATITASFSGQTDTHTVTIAYVPPVLTRIEISGSLSLDEGTTAQYTCTASYSDGTSAVVAPSWSENSSYATINGSGVLAAGNVVSDQNVTVSASFGGQIDTHAVLISYVPPVLTGITISGPASVDEETSAQYTCTANYSDGTSAAVAPSWSENSSYTTISGSGVLTASNVASDQSVTVDASYEGKSDEHMVSIVYVPPAVESITISGPGSIEENSDAQYTCTAHYSDGSSAAVSPVWSEDAVFASIEASGLLSIGNITADEQVAIHASFGGKVAEQILTITAVGDQVVFPLSGFYGKTVSAELWDVAAQSTMDLGEEFEPEEIVIENVNPDQWYWLGLREYDAAAGEWVLVHGRWIWM